MATIVALAMTACGSGNGEGDDTARTDETSTTMAGGEDSPAAGGSSATTRPNGASSSTPTTASTAGGGGSTSPGGTNAPNGTTSTLQARVDRPCLQPGDEQTLSVTGALPNDHVIYDTEYSDGKSGLNTSYGSGHGSGTTDGAGTFRATWRLAPTVPSGRTKVNVAAPDNSGVVTRTAEFVVTSPGQACP